MCYKVVHLYEKKDCLVFTSVYRKHIYDKMVCRANSDIQGERIECSALCWYALGLFFFVSSDRTILLSQSTQLTFSYEQQ